MIDVEQLKKYANDSMNMALAQIDRTIGPETRILNASYMLGKFAAAEDALMKIDQDAFAELHENRRADWERVSTFLESIYKIGKNGGE